MKAVFGIVGLLLVAAIVGVLAKKQLSAGVAPPAVTAPGETAAPPRNPQQQVQQFQQAVEGAMQQPRAVPDDVK